MPLDFQVDYLNLIYNWPTLCHTVSNKLPVASVWWSLASSHRLWFKTNWSLDLRKHVALLDPQKYVNNLRENQCKRKRCVCALCLNRFHTREQNGDLPTPLTSTEHEYRRAQERRRHISWPGFNTTLATPDTPESHSFYNTQQTHPENSLTKKLFFPSCCYLKSELCSLSQQTHKGLHS